MVDSVAEGRGDILSPALIFWEGRGRDAGFLRAVWYFRAISTLRSKLPDPFICSLTLAAFPGCSVPNTVLGPEAQGEIKPCPSSALEKRKKIGTTLLNLIEEVGGAANEHINTPHQGGKRQRQVSGG